VSEWVLNGYNTFEDAGEDEMKLKVDFDGGRSAVNTTLAYADENADIVTAWLTPDQAEAFATMLMYAAQQHRDKQAQKKGL